MRAEACKASSIALPLELLTTSVVQQREALLYPQDWKGVSWYSTSVLGFSKTAFRKQQIKQNSLSFDRVSIRSQRAKIRSRDERCGVSSREHSPVLWGRPVSGLFDTRFHFPLLSPHNFLMDCVHWSHLWFLGPEGFPPQSKCWVNTKWMDSRNQSKMPTIKIIIQLYPGDCRHGNKTEKKTQPISIGEEKIKLQIFVS